MNSIDHQLAAFPDAVLSGYNTDSFDHNGPTIDTWATGFLYEGAGFKGSANFPNPILLSSHTKAWDGSRTYQQVDGEKDVLAAIIRVWPGMAAHV